MAICYYCNQRFTRYRKCECRCDSSDSSEEDTLYWPGHEIRVGVPAAIGGPTGCAVADMNDVVFEHVIDQNSDGFTYPDASYFELMSPDTQPADAITSITWLQGPAGTQQPVPDWPNGAASLFPFLAPSEWQANQPWPSYGAWSNEMPTVVIIFREHQDIYQLTQLKPTSWHWHQHELSWDFFHHDNDTIPISATTGSHGPWVINAHGTPAATTANPVSKCIIRSQYSPGAVGHNEGGLPLYRGVKKIHLTMTYLKGRLNASTTILFGQTSILALPTSPDCYLRNGFPTMQEPGGIKYAPWSPWSPIGGNGGPNACTTSDEELWQGGTVTESPDEVNLRYQDSGNFFRTLIGQPALAFHDAPLFPDLIDGSDSVVSMVLGQKFTITYPSPVDIYGFAIADLDDSHPLVRVRFFHHSTDETPDVYVFDLGASSGSGLRWWNRRCRFLPGHPEHDRDSDCFYRSIERVEFQYFQQNETNAFAADPTAWNVKQYELYYLPSTCPRPDPQPVTPVIQGPYPTTIGTTAPLCHWQEEPLTYNEAGTHEGPAVALEVGFGSPAFPVDANGRHSLLANRPIRYFTSQVEGDLFYLTNRQLFYDFPVRMGGLGGQWIDWTLAGPSDIWEIKLYFTRRDNEVDEAGMRNNETAMLFYYPGSDIAHSANDDYNWTIPICYPLTDHAPGFARSVTMSSAEELNGPLSRPLVRGVDRLLMRASLEGLVGVELVGEPTQPVN